MSNIEFLGAVNTVTGSKFIVSSNDTKVLLDCGMYQGRKDSAYLKNRHFSENTPDVDTCILSHSHIDHSGMLPSLVKEGFDGDIYATPATTDLCKHMLRDSVNVFTKELPVISKILRQNKNNTLVAPLYEIEDVDHCMSRFVPIRYNMETKLSRDFSFSFHDSCHILGSASIKLNVKEHNVSHRIWYTSDIGHDTSLLHDQPKIPQDIDYLVIESTYGNKKREEEDVEQKVLEAITDAFNRGGKVIIPAFSVGRMQTLILIIHKLHILGLIPNIPIIVNSPLGVKVTRLYEKHEDLIKKESIDFFTDKGLQAFEGPMIQYVTEMSEAKEISVADESSVIISASGMCEGGHIREHLKNNVGDANSTVLFVGYNAIGTLGRRLQECNGQVTVDGESLRVRCKVETIGGLSAHADLGFLINYVEQCIASNAIKTIYLIHGDPDAIKNVKHVLNEKGITNVVIPELGKKYKL